MMDHKPKLLFVVNVSWFFVSHRLALARAARNAGYEVHVATQIASVVDRQIILEAGLTLHEVAISRSSAGLWNNVATLRALVALFRRLRPDLVHLVTMKPNVLGGWAARLAGIPAVVYAISGLGFVFTAEGKATGVRRAILKWVMRSSLNHHNSRAVFQNPDDLRALLEAGIVKARNAALIRGSGVDLDEYPVATEVAGPIRVLLATRLLREKGVAEYVAAARALRMSGLSVQFLLAGDVDEANPGSLSRAEVQAWHDAGDIQWLGHVAPMAGLFASVHVVVLPSYREGNPKVLIEAAASGRPIVTTDVPGCREIVTHELNGLLVPPRNVEALALAIRRLVESGAERVRLGLAGRERVAADYTVVQVVAQTLRVYRELGVAGEIADGAPAPHA